MSSFKDNILIIFPSLLISLLPISLISGPFLSDLSVVLVGIFFLVNIFLKKEYKFLKNKFLILFCVFSLYLFLNSLVNYYDYHSIRSSLGYLRFGLFSLAIFYFLEQKKEIINWLFLAFVFCYVILIVDGYFQYFNKSSLFFGLQTDLSGRVSSLFGSEQIMGSYLSRLFPVFLGITFFLYHKNNKMIFLISIIFILIEVLIFLSGERAAFFFNTLAAIFVIIMIKDFKKIRFFSLAISFLVIILLSTYDSTAKKRIWDNTISQMGFDSEKKYLFSEVHQSHYLSAYKMYLDNKIIGIGVRNFRNFCNEPEYKISDLSCTTHPHNTYVQLLSETGLVGLGFIIIVFFYFIYKCLEHLYYAVFKKKYYFNNFEVCLMSSILITLWPFVPTGNFFNNWVSIIYYYPIGFLLWSLNKKKYKR